MNVLHINTDDRVGGAARAAYRLHGALRKHGATSQMLVRRKVTSDPDVYRPTGLVSRMRHIAAQRLEVWSKDQINIPWTLNRFDNRIANQINQIAPDIVNLHWIGRGFVPIGALKNIAPPLVWTLHDMWAFTGGCHYSEACNRFTQRCGCCPLLHSSEDNDISRTTWQHKHYQWKDSPLTIVAPSRWLAQAARASSLFAQLTIRAIPNGIDTQIFQPYDNDVTRRQYGLPLDRKLILFGAASGKEDPRKGGDLLDAALSKLPDNVKTRIGVVAVGHHIPEFRDIAVFPIGYISDEQAMAAIYSSVDAFLLPSRQDNLPNMGVEAMACGTPVVGFKIGGVPDIVDHQVNGYLAQPYDTDDFAEGLRWILDADKSKYRALSHNARQKAVTTFDDKVVAQQYLDLYREILSETNPS